MTYEMQTLKAERHDLNNVRRPCFGARDLPILCQFISVVHWLCAVPSRKKI